ncbi:MAG: hypothetical protein OEW87_13775 [Flavobacteriaceae bacterium]|nr:hypothetical protein [Flavobacteriaceae bacterium]
MTIPSLNENGELDEGEYEATLDEIAVVYGLSSDRRKVLMQGLREAAENLEKAGVKKIWVNGSFITDKDEPNDIDGCWEYNDLMDLSAIDPVFLSKNSRAEVKEKYGLGFFIAQRIEGRSKKPFPKFFQVNRDGDAKGILFVELGDRA